jgi:hypothetical protein
VWDQGAADQWRYGAVETLARGFQVVVSSGCYFLEYAPPWATTWGWQDNYACDVQNITDAAAAAGVADVPLDKLIGGHASRWGEGTDGDNWCGREEGRREGRERRKGGREGGTEGGHCAHR